MTAEQALEQRKNARLSGRKEAIVIHPHGICNIKDISLSGLSFQCTHDHYFPSRWQIEILFAGTPLYIKKVPVRLVREKMNDVISFISTPTKEVGVEFLEVDAEKSILLSKVLSCLQGSPAN